MSSFFLFFFRTFSSITSPKFIFPFVSGKTLNSYTTKCTLNTANTVYISLFVLGAFRFLSSLFCVPCWHFRRRYLWYFCLFVLFVGVSVVFSSIFDDRTSKSLNFPILYFLKLRKKREKTNYHWITLGKIKTYPFNIISMVDMILIFTGKIMYMLKSKEIEGLNNGW